MQTFTDKEKFIQLLGLNKFSDDPEVLLGYTDSNDFTAGGNPVLAVYPESKDEVQQIVQLANQSKVALIPVSSGPPRSHRGTTPSGDCIFMDFSRMNRIIKIDPDNRFVMVEPGVTFGELIPALKQQGLRISTPLLPRATKSVVASYLEREPGTIPKYQYDFMDPLLTLEIVYGTGDVFRTGSASGPGSMEILKADKVNPWGPGSLDYYRFVSGAQGSMGLVTWAVTKVEMLPLIKQVYYIPVKDIGTMIVPVNELLMRRVVDECLVLNSNNLATILAENWNRDYETLKNNLPPWTIMVSIAGYQRRPEERVLLQEKYLFETCAGLGLEPRLDLPGADGREAMMPELLTSSWNNDPHWKLRAGNKCHDIFFLSPMSKVPGFIGLMSELVKQTGYDENRLGTYIQPVVQGRGCHCEFNLPCSEDDREVMELLDKAPQVLMDNGAFFSRPYGRWADIVYRQYDEGVAALRKLKKIFDPNNILNPGRLCF